MFHASVCSLAIDTGAVGVPGVETAAREEWVPRKIPQMGHLKEKQDLARKHTQNVISDSKLF